MTLRRRLAQLENVTCTESKPAPRVYTYEEWEAVSEVEKEAGGDVIIVVSEKAKQLAERLLSGEGTE
jgi:hypothetical protein